MFDFLAKEGVSPRILDQVRAFRGEYDVSEGVKDRIPAPAYMYYGKEIWEQAATALLAGENILLLGPKATGKNVLAEGLAALFGRPGWDVSFHVNTDAASLIGNIQRSGTGDYQKSHQRIPCHRWNHMVYCPRAERKPPHLAGGQPGGACLYGCRGAESPSGSCTGKPG